MNPECWLRSPHLLSAFPKKFFSYEAGEIVPKSGVGLVTAVKNIIFLNDIDTLHLRGIVIELTYYLE